MKYHTPFILLLLVIFCLPAPLRAGQMAFLLIDNESYLVNKAISGLERTSSPIEVKALTLDDVTETSAARDFLESSQVIFLDAMKSQLADFLLKNINLADKRIYIVRGARDNSELVKRGAVFSPEIEEYYANPTLENIRNLIYRVAHLEFDSQITYQTAVKFPRLGIYHPHIESLFTGYNQYLQWYHKQTCYSEDKPWVGVMFYASQLEVGQVEALDYVIKELETAGFNVLACFGPETEIISRLLLDQHKHSRVDLVLAFSLKFSSALSGTMATTLVQLDTPIFNLINLSSISLEQWRRDPVGIPPMDIVWSISNPEISGLIEPSVVIGKVRIDRSAGTGTVFKSEPIKDNLALLIPRLKAWVKLKRRPAKDKRVAILYYNNSRGKQNVGATYLNVFSSLELILQRLKVEGYSLTTDERISRDSIKELVLKYGRNIGSWAPGELEKLLKSKKVVRLSLATYKQWFAKLPKDLRDNIIRQWGPVESSKLMIKDGYLVLPVISLGNVLIMPQPARGWGDDPMKLYHDTTLYPHHQYVAAYLWLKNTFQADAIIHLGTHGTHEWLPGKQAGLSTSCPPEALIGNIPNLYPYNVDVVGEGVQAKRRGRAVIIDHLTPAIREAGLHHEYSDLYDKINNYRQTLGMGSGADSAKLQEIVKLVQQIGIDRDLGIEHFKADSLVAVEDYLLEIKQNFMPYGLHTFGQSPRGENLEETANAVVERNRGTDRNEIAKALEISGQREIDNLIKGLNGGYIPSGEGNDPLRNPAAIPTGKNFYGFDPLKIPSRTAWKLGQKAAQQIIDKSLKEKAAYPEKVAVVLWSTETIRNEGLNESTILSLLGLKPVWDQSERVVGVAVVPGRILQRPRIDVLINPSGLYRDLFPNLVIFLDKAIQQAAVQTDIKNLISEHNQKITESFIKQGMSPAAASRLARFRIFAEKPGDYGTGVAEMTANSGIWEKSSDVAEVYENREGHAFGQGQWGVPAKASFKENLKGVTATVHSLSSNIFGTLDNDDMFQYLGGLSMAVKKESGRSPDTMIIQQRVANQVKVEDAAQTFGREIRTRYLNPKWIEGMKKEDYAGAREMSDYVEYMWGWQVTVPESIDKAKWEQTYEVYVEDKYGLELKEFFNRANPWAYQSVTARMLEATRKGYWQAEESVKKKLAVEYALNVIEKGVACCDHTCNNPILNQMVVNILSLPGVMSAEMVEKFKLKIEQAAAKSLSKQVEDRRTLQEKLRAGFKSEPLSSVKSQEQKKESRPDSQSDSQKKLDKQKNIEGYKMEEMKTDDDSTALSSSGIQWFASLFIIFLIIVFFCGVKGRRRK